MSYPSSIQNSRHRFHTNKQNEVPNFSTNSTYTPYCPKKMGSSQLPSIVLRQIGIDNQFETTQNSLKTLFQHFSQHTSANNTNTKSHKRSTNFVETIRLFTNKPRLSIKEVIRICQEQNIFNKQQINCDQAEIKKLSKYKQQLYRQSITKMLTTDLGMLKIQYICDILANNPANLTRHQEQIINILIPMDAASQQLDSDGGSTIQQKLWDSYQQLLDDDRTNQEQIQKLANQFRNLFNSKLAHKLHNQHFKLELLQKIKNRSHSQVISYRNLYNILVQLCSLSRLDINLIVKYLYSVQYCKILSMIDPSCRINTQILLSVLFSRADSLQPYQQLQQQQQQMDVSLQNRNKQYMLQQCFKTIGALQHKNREYQIQLQKRDQQIVKLYSQIQLLQIESRQNGCLMQQTARLRNSSWDDRYRKRIEQLQSLYANQKRLTHWYQRELDNIVKSVNREHVIRKHYLQQQQQHDHEQQHD